MCGDGCCFRAIDCLVSSCDCTSCFCSHGVLSPVCVPDSSSSLERICAQCFASCGLVEFGMPVSVRLAAESLVNVHWQVALFAAMAAVSVRLMVSSFQMIVIHVAVSMVLCLQYLFPKISVSFMKGASEGVRVFIV